jgi:hypothetical protein
MKHLGTYREEYNDTDLKGRGWEIVDWIDMTSMTRFCGCGNGPYRFIKVMKNYSRDTPGRRDN